MGTLEREWDVFASGDWIGLISARTRVGAWCKASWYVKNLFRFWEITVIKYSKRPTSYT